MNPLLERFQRFVCNLLGPGDTYIIVLFVANMKLMDIHSFGNVFDLFVTSAGDKLRLETARYGKRITSPIVERGKPITIRLSRSPEA